MDMQLDDGRTVSVDTNRDLIGEGGQGRVYATSGLAIKVPFDTKDVLSQDAFKALRSLGQVPGVVAPSHQVSDASGQVVGHAMPLVDGAESLVRYCAPTFQVSNAISPKDVGGLCLALRTMLTDLHSRGVVVGDLNPYNILVRAGEPLLIDVDNLHWPPLLACSAVMENIADPTRPLGDFTPDSDWFSYAVVTFQLWTGLHPYKGKHPQVKKLAARMKAGLSVFDPDVRKPKSARDFTVIPQAWKAWYKDVFSHRTRTPPPATMAEAAHSATLPRHATGLLTDMVQHGIGWAALNPTQQVMIVSSGEQIPFPKTRAGDRLVSLNPSTLGILRVENGRACLHDATQYFVGPAVTSLFRVGSGLYGVQKEGTVLHIQARYVGKRPMLFARQLGRVGRIAYGCGAGILHRLGERWFVWRPGQVPCKLRAPVGKVGHVAGEGRWLLLLDSNALRLIDLNSGSAVSSWAPTNDFQVADLGGGPALVRRDDEFEIWDGASVVPTHGSGPWMAHLGEHFYTVVGDEPACWRVGEALSGVW